MCPRRSKLEIRLLPTVLTLLSPDIHKPSSWQLLRPTWGSLASRKASWITDSCPVTISVVLEREYYIFFLSPASPRNSPRTPLDPDHFLLETIQYDAYIATGQECGGQRERVLICPTSMIRHRRCTSWISWGRTSVTEVLAYC